jgi:hypothetical protein
MAPNAIIGSDTNCIFWTVRQDRDDCRQERRRLFRIGSSILKIETYPAIRAAGIRFDPRFVLAGNLAAIFSISGQRNNGLRQFTLQSRSGARRFANFH